MGALYKGLCYVTNDDAADAFYLSAAPALTAGGTSYLSWFQKVGSQWAVSSQSFSPTASGVSTVALTVPSFPTCDPAQPFYDGMSVGWGVGGAIVAAWVVKNLRRGL